MSQDNNNKKPQTIMKCVRCNISMPVDIIDERNPPCRIQIISQLMQLPILTFGVCSNCVLDVIGLLREPPKAISKPNYLG